ncbi:hypothetical protein BCR44DRAFT_1502121 [Catenaria anguillulae PL171]|uniref:Prefoldin n=1 Tax=Catenaria anguillulae PL171 TaxID=765915 RepID=A0A1Y2HCK9_9FUNG|nr:hypothetical protein BCR44DRAFT_1502121 [Catenaria anguillulae PL171]
MSREAGPASDPEYLQGIAMREAIAEDILMSQDLLAELDRRRTSNREAMKHLLPHRSSSPPPAGSTSSNRGRSSRSPSPSRPAVKGSRVWINVGDMFIRVNKSMAVEMISKDHTTMEKEMEETKSQIRSQAQRLQFIDAEIQERSKQYDLRTI